jgi:Ca2+-binding EF-hand superfamily protein
VIIPLQVDEMIRMVDKNGDGQVAFDEFYRMVTGGRNPPAGLGSAVRHSIIGKTDINIKGLQRNGGGGSFTNVMQSPQSGPEIVKARKAKRKALDEFARDNYLKPESIKRAHRRFQALDKKKSGVMDYTEFCEVLQVEPSVQCEGLFKMYDYNRSGLIDTKELLIALANFTGAGKDDK